MLGIVTVERDSLWQYQDAWRTFHRAFTEIQVAKKFFISVTHFFLLVSHTDAIINLSCSENRIIHQSFRGVLNVE